MKTKNHPLVFSANGCEENKVGGSVAAHPWGRPSAKLEQGSRIEVTEPDAELDTREHFIEQCKGRIVPAEPRERRVPKFVERDRYFQVNRKGFQVAGPSGEYLIELFLKSQEIADCQAALPDAFRLVHYGCTDFLRQVGLLPLSTVNQMFECLSKRGFYTGGGSGVDNN